MRSTFVLVLALAALTGFVAANATAASHRTATACGPAPHKLAKRPALGDFPTPKGVVYTSNKKAGPTKIVGAYWSKGDLTAIHKAYSKALKAAKYTITHEEQDAADSEVVFKGFGTSGQVKLSKRCSSRILITITIRPA
jgi:hypothetical protein